MSTADSTSSWLTTVIGSFVLVVLFGLIFSPFLGLLAITQGSVVLKKNEQKWTNLCASEVWSPLIFFLMGATEVWNFVGSKMSSFEQIWKVFSKTVIISHKNLFKNAILGSTGNYTYEIRFKG